MSLKAVIKTGGKQYLVKEGDILEIEKIDLPLKKKISFKDVLLVFDKDGQSLEIGQPQVKAVVEAEVLEQKKAPKIQVIKYKAKTRYHRSRGHRQLKTKIKINKIKLEKKQPLKPKKEKEVKSKDKK
jgi:large subunit ribosomal protein L21